MEGNKQPFLYKKRPSSPQLRNTGGNKKGKWSSGEDRSFENSSTSDTVYRIVCPSNRIGSVIGKGGNIVKVLREETQAKISVAESVRGSDERVITIHSPSAKLFRKHDTKEVSASGKEDDKMEPHCAAQDALLKVHDRIVLEDIIKASNDEDDIENMVTARLLVPNNMVGCVLGKKGDVIQRLRSETGASIRVLRPDSLPTCAMSTDQMVQVSGKQAVARKALYEISTLLHQNPRKDESPLDFPMSYGSQGINFTGPPASNMIPQRNQLWSRRDSNSNDTMPLSWRGEFGDRSARFGNYDDIPPIHGGGEPPTEFFMKILCPARKIGGIIGKGGINVRQLQHETGATILVDDALADSEERVIRVSAIEDMWNPRSQTIDAILELQIKASEISEKGTVSTRLLVQSSKVGCILGQGGNVINEMRRRTRADIRVFSKEDKPKCADNDEELVQISGSSLIVKDLLVEIASRLRERFLRDPNSGPKPPPVRPPRDFSPRGNHPRYPTRRGGGSSGYEYLEGDRREYEHPTYPVPPSATRYSNVMSPRDMEMPYSSMGSGGRSRGREDKVGKTRLELPEYDYGSGGSNIRDRHAAPEHSDYNLMPSYYGKQKNNPPPSRSPYQNMNLPSEYNPYPNHNSAPTTTHYPNYNTSSLTSSSYSNMNSQQSIYENYNPSSSYENMNAQQQSSLYENYGSRGNSSYQYEH
ncbi:KH domain-containing protein At4g18375-like isoform X1 [Impatiens glandulifera]|uniref:KH domain-containing protein At4g18375-like isoform X1 n=1 Tax=Impatiens glandulifera TaxID=253017 RepID=UPI001FB0FF07|nr:KH domain-containing protein At4g18375-like isoform X1 [Impatiens glandulifera]